MGLSEKQCPYCKEMIKAEAIKCRFCGEFLEEPPKAAVSAGAVPATAPIVQPSEGAHAEMTELADRVAQQRKMQSAAETLYEGPLSRIALFGATGRLSLWFLAAIAIGVGAYFLDGRVPPFIAAKIPNAVGIVWGIAAVVAVIGLSIFGYRYLVFKNRRFVVTTDRIESYRGLFSRSMDNIDMWRVNDLRFHQSFSQRLVGVGVVFVESTDATDPTLVIGPVPKAKDLYQRLREAVLEADRRRGVVHIER